MDSLSKFGLPILKDDLIVSDLSSIHLISKVRKGLVNNPTLHGHLNGDIASFVGAIFWNTVFTCHLCLLVFFVCS
jgi:hypothetical protein